MIEIYDRNFEKEVMECKLPIFACFTTSWCGSCFPTCLVAGELDKEYYGNVKFVRLDVEKNPEIAQRYHVTTVPTILVIRNSQEVNRLLGFQSRSTLKFVLDNVTAG
jgi:thioredoxin 1